MQDKVKLNEQELLQVAGGRMTEEDYDNKCRSYNRKKNKIELCEKDRDCQYYRVLPNQGCRYKYHY